MTPPLGPLAGVRVLELGGIGPGPFAAMTLADLGADVVRIDRPGEPTFFPGAPRENLLNRGKRSVAVDLKTPEGLATALRLTAVADIVIEGFRPGVAERLGIGPDAGLAQNPALVYGRMTGWGQDGPRALDAGHDINYIAVTGALHAVGEADGPPVVPANFVGDYGGGGAYLVIGVLAALHEARATGRGQVVDAAIVDGVGHLLTGTHARMASGTWTDRRGSNLLDGGAPFYAVYETADGRHVAVGAIEAKFFAALIDGLGLRDRVEVARQHDRATWPALRAAIAARFAQRTRDEWAEAFAGTDACVSPVLGLAEAASDPQVTARASLRIVDGHLQSATTPRFSAHPAYVPTQPPQPGQHTAAVLADWGVPARPDATRTL